MSPVADLSDAALLATLRRQYRRQGRPVADFLDCSVATEKRPIPYALPASFEALPPGQRRVAEALVGGDRAPTYEPVAGELDLHVGTVLGYPNRMREHRPEAYADLVRWLIDVEMAGWCPCADRLLASFGERRN